MPERVVLMDGLSSQVLYGDEEYGGTRLEVNDENGNSVSAALPLLLSEGWKVKAAVPLQASSPMAIFILKSGEDLEE